MPSSHSLRLRERVLERLDEFGQSQAWLAKKMKVTPQTLSRMLSKGNPRLATLERMARALGISVANLVERNRT